MSAYRATLFFTVGASLAFLVLYPFPKGREPFALVVLVPALILLIHDRWGGR